MLVDSRSMCSAIPPDPGDKEVVGASLKAVNNTRIKFFRFKDLEIKIGRKTYKFRAVKAQVSSPVLGWDFARQHKLDMVWNEFGDICFFDKGAKITPPLHFKDLAKEVSLAHKNLCLVTEYAPVCPGDVEFQVAAMQELDPEIKIENEVEDIEKVPDSPYKDLLSRFPDLLRHSFGEEFTHHGVIHKISTGEAKPCRAKTTAPWFS